MIETNLCMSDKIGYLLFKKGIIDTQILEKSLNVKSEEKGKIKRNLAQILVQNFDFDHDTIFKEVAILYAFRELELPEGEPLQHKIETIKQAVDKVSDQLKQMMAEHKVIAYALNARKYEVVFLKKKDFDKISQSILPVENVYLKAIEDSSVEMDIESDEASLDEQELDAEINKSALINLVEGALVEGVRKDASDIHFIPKAGHKTEILIRIDGNLQPWHIQENTLPEAVVAVIKDRSKGMDRFEREKAQDGFIQREIDGQIIRFRVSVLPMVGTELRNKFESVVIRILDDRKVVKDLSKLGLTGYAQDAFVKAISQPQGMVILTGPTGSGKSTTLVAALYQVIDPSVNVLTVEDPVEYVIEGARQLKIGYKMDFEQAIRSILRH